MREIDLIVAARDVQPGDKVFAKVPERMRAKATNQLKYQWSTVGAIRHAETTHRIILVTTGYETWKHPDEGVHVRRLERHGV
jgi:hypothetical protein